MDRNEARAAAGSSLSRRLLPWGLAVVLFVSTAFFLVLWFLRPTPSRLASQFTVEAPPGTTSTNIYGATAVSPDGHYVVFSATKVADRPMLWLRHLDSLEARPLLGTEGANLPFWSPDSKSIAFVANYKLQRL